MSDRLLACRDMGKEAYLRPFLALQGASSGARRPEGPWRLRSLSRSEAGAPGGGWSDKGASGCCGCLIETVTAALIFGDIMQKGVFVLSSARNL